MGRGGVHCSLKAPTGVVDATQNEEEGGENCAAQVENAGREDGKSPI